MKNLIILLCLVVSLFTVNAQTNVVEKGEKQSYEMTFGGYGVSIDGENEVGADVSLSTNPFKKLPNLWVGAVQSVYWTPSFGGSTDLNVNWSTHLFKELYINTGYSTGIEYGLGKPNFRHGPEVTLQYYIGENAFVYSGVNYDIGQQYSGFRYSWGLGIIF